MASYGLAAMLAPSSDGWNRVVAGVRRVSVGLAPLVLLYVAYTIVRWALTDRGPRLGPGHAERVIDLEARFHVGWEAGIQAFSLDHGWLIRMANWYYVAGFLPVLLLAAAAAAWRAPDRFMWWRNVFVLTLGMALVGFSLFPLAPPRMLGEEHGYVDTLMVYGPQYYGDAQGSSLFNGFGRLPSMVNEYAAMPSMHVAWSAIAGVLLACAIRRRWATGLAVLHPLLMAFTVVVTGNHYVLDVFGGLVVLVVAVAMMAAWHARISIAVPTWERSSFDQRFSTERSRIATSDATISSPIGCRS